MPSKSPHLLPALGVSGAMLGLALLASLTGSGQGRTVETEIGADLTGTEAIRADDTAPRRHRRHSLTMPYFSFAQSLRPRN